MTPLAGPQQPLDAPSPLGTITAVADTARAATLAYVQGQGVQTVGVTDANGGKWTLSLPDDALTGARTITLTPAASVTASGTLAPTAAVILEPDGLELADSGTLVYTPADGKPGAILLSRQDGSGTAFAPPLPKDQPAPPAAKPNPAAQNGLLPALIPIAGSGQPSTVVAVGPAVSAGSRGALIFHFSQASDVPPNVQAEVNGALADLRYVEAKARRLSQQPVNAPDMPDGAEPGCDPMPAQTPDQEKAAGNAEDAAVAAFEQPELQLIQEGVGTLQAIRDGQLNGLNTENSAEWQTFTQETVPFLVSRIEMKALAAIKRYDVPSDYSSKKFGRVFKAWSTSYRQMALLSGNVPNTDAVTAEFSAWAADISRWGEQELRKNHDFRKVVFALDFERTAVLLGGHESDLLKRLQADLTFKAQVYLSVAGTSNTPSKFPPITFSVADQAQVTLKADELLRQITGTGQGKYTQGMVAPYPAVFPSGATKITPDAYDMNASIQHLDGCALTALVLVPVLGSPNEQWRDNSSGVTGTLTDRLPNPAQFFANQALTGALIANSGLMVTITNRQAQCVDKTVSGDFAGFTVTLHVILTHTP